MSVGADGRAELKTFTPRVVLDLRSLTLSSWDVMEQYTGRKTRREVNALLNTVPARNRQQVRIRGMLEWGQR